MTLVDVARPLPPAAWNRLKAAWQAARLAQAQYETLGQMTVEALGYDTTVQKVRLDLDRGVVSTEQEESPADAVE